MNQDVAFYTRNSLGPVALPQGVKGLFSLLWGKNNLQSLMPIKCSETLEILFTILIRSFLFFL